MDMKEKGDLVINGFGASNGGTFRQVIVNGFGTVNSDIDCIEFESNGFGTVDGNVTSEQTKINGKAKVKGTIESQHLSIDGTAKIGENLLAKKLKVSGKASVGGKVKSEEIKINGVLRVEGDCEAEIFKADSQFAIGGLLNAEQITIQLHGPCKAKEIGGETILVKHRGSFFESLIKPLFSTQLEVEFIEGDKIELENTIAKVVRGNQVKIGRNCEIGVVEYREDFSQHKNAVVKESIKV
jgi:cytoskeletal protein CcmA (bactofilin family)